MMKHEFETLAVRNGGGTINGYLFESIEHLYMSDNHYHQYNNPQGIDESKQAFVNRVFSGKVNTAKTILAKTIAELQRENRYCLQGNATEAELERHDRLIAQHETTMSQW